MSIDSKHCWKCNETKPVDQFYKNRRRKDGLQDHCIPCTKATNKKYYAGHVEKVRDYNAAYRLQRFGPPKPKQAPLTHEEKLAHRRQKYAENREAELAKAKAAREADPEKYRARQRAYYAANKDKVLASVRKWQEENPERYRMYMKMYWANRRAKESGIEGTLTTEEVYAIFADDTCHWCGKPGGDQLDHKTPLALGGINRPENCAPIHHLCHDEKHRQDKAAIAAKQKADLEEAA